MTDLGRISEARSPHRHPGRLRLPRMVVAPSRLLGAQRQSGRLRLACMVAIGVLLSMSLLPACKKKTTSFSAGEACAPGRVECLNEKAALLCGDGNAFVEVPCRGKNGCKTSGALALCDRSISEKGDACALGEDAKDRAFCTEDGKSALLCRAGKLVPAVECTKADCHLDGRRAECARMTAKEAAPCGTEGDTYCAEDEKSLLRCKSGSLEAFRQCHGKEGCRGARNPACDDTLATAGDPCVLSGLVVCAEDGENELVCQNGRFAISRPCKKSGCKVTSIAQKRIDCR